MYLLASCVMQWSPDNSHKKYAKKLCELSRMCELFTHQSQQSMGKHTIVRISEGQIILYDRLLCSLLLDYNLLHNGYLHENLYYLHSPYFCQLVNGKFAAQEVDDVFNFITVLHLIYVTWSNNKPTINNLNG